MICKCINNDRISKLYRVGVAYSYMYYGDNRYKVLNLDYAAVSQVMSAEDFFYSFEVWN